LQAEVDLHADGEAYLLLKSLDDELKYLTLTSAARVHQQEAEGLRVEVRPSAQTKCERCWHYRADVNGEGLCGRCVTNLRGPGEPRRFA
jgi:isoleucyl-tRNA synthetase